MLWSLSSTQLKPASFEKNKALALTVRTSIIAASDYSIPSSTWTSRDTEKWFSAILSSFSSFIDVDASTCCLCCCCSFFPFFLHLHYQCHLKQHLHLMKMLTIDSVIPLLFIVHFLMTQTLSLLIVIHASIKLWPGLNVSSKVTETFQCIPTYDRHTIVTS